MIAALEFAIILIMFLNCVVGEMNTEIWDFFFACGVGERGGSNVALSKEIDFELVGKEDPYSDVKFTTIKKKRILHVFLYDEGGRLNDEASSLCEA